MTRAGYPLDCLTAINARRDRVMAAGHFWIEAALIGSVGPVVYAEERKTRAEVAGILRGLLALRRAGAVVIVQWQCHHRRADEWTSIM
jgi:hypothetical protein